MNKITIGFIATCCTCASSFAEDSLQSIIKEGSVSGNFRTYYNTRSYDTRDNESALSVGGALKVETGPLGWAKIGVGYYTAQDLGTNDDDPAKVNGRLGSEVEVLGEAYVSFSQWESTLTVGRQKIGTPFANTGDAFIVPFTFEGTSYKNKALENFTFEVDYLTAIKNRNSNEFVDTGAWSTARYGLTPTNTSGTLILGATYQTKPMKLQAWHYEFADLFSSTYLQANYNFGGSGSVKPFVAAQFGTQSDTGDKLLGEVDSTIIGLQGGASVGKAKFTLAYNSVAEELDTFNNGAFLAPYNFSTSPLFTNNMLQSLENTDSGDATKVTFNYNFPKVKLKISYAEFDLDSVVDREALDMDVTYSFDNYYKGLSLRWRMEIVTSDTSSVEQTNHRFQLQYTF